jgi:hypothetical protein
MLPARLANAARTPLREAHLLAGGVTIGLTLIAFVGGALVLGLDLWPGFLSSRAHRLVSAGPLLAIAIGYLVLQIRLRPAAHELMKRLLLSLAFIFWSASQVDPASGWAPVADDLAIALFVLDLGLIIWDELHSETSHGDRSEPSHNVQSSLLALQPCPCCGGVSRATPRAD